MRQVKRVLSDNPVAISNCHYSTHILRLKCCDQDPVLYAFTNIQGLLLSGVWKFICAECGREGAQGITPNAAAAGWNESWHTEGLGGQ